jgi:hypothetical protein
LRLMLQAIWEHQKPRGSFFLGLLEVIEHVLGTWDFIDTTATYGYGSIPINTIFSGMNIHKSQLFWCSPGVQGFDTLPYIKLQTCFWDINFPGKDSNF